MKRSSTKRYCVDHQAIHALYRDGMGWGHDLECGCYQDVDMTSHPTRLRRLWTAITGRV